MNEFQQQQEEAEMKALKEASPEWKSQPLPTRDSLQTDVVQPVWNKLEIPQSNFNTAQQPDQQGSQQLLATVIDETSGLVELYVVNVIGASLVRKINSDADL